jgi:TniQ
MSCGTRLLCVSPPFADENIVGYILRLTELNRYDTPSWILQLAGIKSYLQSNLSFAFNTTWNLSPLERLTGIEKSKLSTLLYSPVDTPQKTSRDYQVLGGTVPQYMIRLRYPKLCPACLQETAYTRKYWDLAPVTTCPKHGCLLIDECPGCKKRLSWCRRTIGCCRCEFDWREYTPLPVDNLELRLAERLHLICNQPVPNTNRQRSEITNPLLGLDLKNFLSAVFFIASQFKGRIDTKGKHLAPSIRNAELHTLLCKAWSVFEDWPHNYFSFFEWRREQGTGAHAAYGLRKDFAEYKSALYKQLGAKPLDFMRSAFEEYLTTKWNGGYTAHVKRLNGVGRKDGRYASRREAKELLKIGVASVDKLISAGRLKAIVRRQGGSRLILIERQSILAFKRELDHSLYLKQVRGLLGLSHKRVLELVECQLLKPLRGSTVNGYSDWRFSGDEVKGLLRLVREKVKPSASVAPKDLVSLLMALRPLGRVNVRLGQFLKDILGGEIAPCGKSAKPGLTSFLFLKRQIADYASRQRQSQMGDVFTATEAARYLRVTRDVIYFLTRCGILASQDRPEERYPDLLISKSDLECFESAYFLPSKAAARLGTISGHLTGLLVARGVQPISGPKVDGGRQYVFRRADLGGIDMADLISTDRARRPNPEGVNSRAGRCCLAQLIMAKGRY